MRFSHNTTDRFDIKFLNFNDKIESFYNEEAKTILSNFEKDKVDTLPKLVLFHWLRLFNDTLLKHCTCFPLGIKTKKEGTIKKELRTMYHYKFDSAADFFIHELGIRKEIQRLREEFNDKSSLNSEIISKTYIGESSYRYLIKRSLKVRGKVVVIYMYWNPYGETSVYIKDRMDKTHVAYNVNNGLICKALSSIIEDFITKNFDDMVLTDKEKESLNEESKRKNQKIKRW